MEKWLRVCQCCSSGECRFWVVSLSICGMPLSIYWLVACHCHISLSYMTSHQNTLILVEIYHSIPPILLTFSSSSINYGWMVNMVNITPAIYQHVNTVIGSLMMLGFSSHHFCVLIQPQTAASITVSLVATQWAFLSTKPPWHQSSLMAQVQGSNGLEGGLSTLLIYSSQTWQHFSRPSSANGDTHSRPRL